MSNQDNHASQQITPQNIEAERALLACLVLDPDMMLEARRIVEVKDFFNEKTRITFKILSSLYDQQMPFDTFIFMDEVERQGYKEIVKASDFVALANAATGIYTTHYANLVKDSSVRRSRWMMAQILVKKIFDGVFTEEIETWLKNEVLGITHNDSPLLEWNESFVFEDELEKSYGTTQHMADMEKWTMPWQSWNNYIDPAEQGTLITISAADGVGKTVTGEQIAEHWARMGCHGVYVHFELNRKVMMQRRLCRYGSFTRHSLVTNSLTEEESKRRDAAKEFVRSWSGSIQYLHTPYWTMDSVVGQLKSLHKQGLCDFVVIDYLEKAQASTRQMKLFNSLNQREADDVEMLKSFSESDDYGCRMVMLSQFNKEGKELPFDQLTRSKIRGAGEKTEKANVVAMLHKEICVAGRKNGRGEWAIEPGSYDTELGVVIDKNTLGRTGRFKLQSTTPFFSIYDNK